MAIALASQRRARLVAQAQLLVAKDFDETFCDFRVSAVVHLMPKRLRPAVDHQAVQDVRASMQVKRDNLDDGVFAGGDL